MLNHPDPANPSADVSSAATFGIISSTTGTAEHTLRPGVRVFLS